MTTSRTRNRAHLHRVLALAVAVGLGASTHCCSLYAQFGDGDAPASPWSNTSKNNIIEPNRTRTTELVRQPRSLDPVRSFDLKPSRSVEPNFAEPARPAPVTLLGPMSPAKRNLKPIAPNERPLQERSSPGLDFPSESKARLPQRNASYPATASPSHALTQKTPNDAQSDWHRVPASGLILEEFSPDIDIESRSTRNGMLGSNERNPGLPDREEDIPSAHPTVSRMASSPSKERDGSFRLRSSETFAPEEPIQSLSEESNLAVAPAVRPESTPRDTDSSPSLEASHEMSRRDSVPKVPAYESAVREVNMNPVLGREPMSLPQSARTAPQGVDANQVELVARAQRISHEILSQPAQPVARAPEILEAPAGWDSVRQELTTRLERCDSLLKRGAVLSAREEAIQGMRRLFRTMDLYRRQSVSEQALDRALAALKEESDFQQVTGFSKQSAVASIVASHSTEALKMRPLEAVSPEIASQHYRMYARYQFMIAADGHQWASDLLYAYGKTLEKEAEQDTTRALMLRSQSVVCYQAATHVAPGQSDAANQLGYALIHLDRIDEAYEALTTSLQRNPTANAWNNLAEVYRRRGAMAEAEYAVQQATALSASQKRYSYDNPEVTEVDPAVFAKFSPMPNVQTAPNANALNSNAVGTPVRDANKANNFMSKIFRL